MVHLFYLITEHKYSYFFCLYMLNIVAIKIISLDQEDVFSIAYLCYSNTLLNSVVGDFCVCVSVIFLLEKY